MFTGGHHGQELRALRRCGASTAPRLFTGGHLYDFLDQAPYGALLRLHPGYSPGDTALDGPDPEVVVQLQRHPGYSPGDTAPSPAPARLRFPCFNVTPAIRRGTPACWRKWRVSPIPCFNVTPAIRRGTHWAALDLPPEMAALQRHPGYSPGDTGRQQPRDDRRHPASTSPRLFAGGHLVGITSAGLTSLPLQRHPGYSPGDTVDFRSGERKALTLQRHPGYSPGDTLSNCVRSSSISCFNVTPAIRRGTQAVGTGHREGTRSRFNVTPAIRRGTRWGDVSDRHRVPRASTSPRLFAGGHAKTPRSRWWWRRSFNVTPAIRRGTLDGNPGDGWDVAELQRHPGYSPGDTREPAHACRRAHCSFNVTPAIRRGTPPMPA